MFFATRKGHYRLVQLLVRRECNLAAKNRYGDLAEDEAIDDRVKQEFATANEDNVRIGSNTSKSAIGSMSCSELQLSQQLRERTLSFLDVRSLCFASQAAFRWYRAADNPALWRKLGVSRWELQLSSSMGVGVSALSILTARRASRTSPSDYPLSVCRPVSCDHTPSRFIIPRIAPKRLPRDDARPQTANTMYR